MKKFASKEIVIGFSVSTRAVHAVVVKAGPGGPQIVRQFSRPRAGMVGMSGDFSEFDGPPADQGVRFAAIDAGDPNVQFDAVPIDESNHFLASEFDIDDRKTNDTAGSASGFDAEYGMRPSTVEIELTDLLDEIADAGFGDASAVFCIGTGDLFTQELTVPAGGKKEGRSGDADRLFALLGQHREVRFDIDRTAFVPMTPSEQGERRVLAIGPRPTDAIVPTLQRLIERKRPLPYIDAVDTEVTLLLGIARLADESSSDGHLMRRMVVRVGAEDTLVFFLEGRNLHYFETVRSVTTFDAPETVCSRILLIQDEYGIGDADEILILGEDREAALLSRFESFFGDVAVRPLRELLPQPADEFGVDQSREAAVAAAAALRFVAKSDVAGRFESVDMVPRKMSRGRRMNVAFNWQLAAVVALLFASTLFFVGRYFKLRHQVEMLEFKLVQYSPKLVSGNASALQARIDSIQTAAADYARALDILDSMLVGSDRWSRSMERTADATAAVPGVWIETWAEADGVLKLDGNATDRDQVVRLAARMDGVIERLSFSKIRDWPVYSFTMNVAVPNELPEAARYLRAQLQSDAGAAAHSD